MLLTAVSAVWTLACAAYTAACAEAMLPGEGVLVVVVVGVDVVLVAPPPDDEDDALGGRVGLATVTVTVLVGAACAPGFPDPVFDFVPDFGGVVVDADVVPPGWNAAYSTEAAGAE